MGITSRPARAQRPWGTILAVVAVVAAFMVALPVGAGAADGGAFTDIEAVEVVPSGRATSAPTTRAGHLTFFSDRATFDLYAPGAALEDFEGTLVASPDIVACAGPLSSATSDACYAAGGVLPGFSLVPLGVGDYAVITAPNFGLSSVAVGPNTFADDTLWTFPDGTVNSVGFDLYSPLGGAVFTIDIYGSGGVWEGSTMVVSPGGATPQFFGVFAGSGYITMVEVTNLTTAGEIFDDLAFGVGGTPMCRGYAATIVGTAGGELILGTPDMDVILALGGDDVVFARAGDDVVCGGDGDDQIRGNAGDDLLDGEAGDDLISGSNGNDRLLGNVGNDTLLGGNGDDRFNGGAGDDYLRGGPGTDTGRGGAGYDICRLDVERECEA